MWSDLARAARKQGVWDVAASAARFCVAYDDGRWSGSGNQPCSICKIDFHFLQLQSPSQLFLRDRARPDLFREAVFLIRTVPLFSRSVTPS